MTKLSRRVLEMEESVTLAASARAMALKAEGRDILSLTLGEPDFVTPENTTSSPVMKRVKDITKTAMGRVKNEMLGKAPGNQ